MKLGFFMVFLAQKHNYGCIFLRFSPFLSNNYKIQKVWVCLVLCCAVFIDTGTSEERKAAFLVVNAKIRLRGFQKQHFWPKNFGALFPRFRPFLSNTYDRQEVLACFVVYTVSFFFFFFFFFYIILDASTWKRRNRVFLLVSSKIRLRFF